MKRCIFFFICFFFCAKSTFNKKASVDFHSPPPEFFALSGEVGLVELNLDQFLHPHKKKCSQSVFLRKVETALSVFFFPVCVFDMYKNGKKQKANKKRKEEGFGASSHCGTNMFGIALVSKA